MMISHEEAFKLECIIRNVFNCKRFGVMGVADADHLEDNPLDAALVIFAPLYLNEKEIPEIENFFDKYNCIFGYPKEYNYDHENVNNYINDLEQLTKKYCNVY